MRDTIVYRVTRKRTIIGDVLKEEKRSILNDLRLVLFAFVSLLLSYESSRAKCARS